MPPTVTLTVFFLDGTRVTYNYPRQAGNDPATVAATVKRALEADRLLLEVEGDLILIPIRSVKYIEVSPAPEQLPAGVLRKARRRK
jgi:hypothetical protein